MTPRKGLTPKLSGHPWPFLALGLALLLAATVAQAQTSVVPAGTGTQADPYRITELGNLVWMSRNGTGAGIYGKYYNLMNDIDASDTANWNDNGTTTSLVGFDPIGSDSSFGFRGVFDGEGHVIRGLVINRPSRESVGLFASIYGPGASVSNLSLEGGAVRGQAEVGFLVGYCGSTTITNCSATGDVSAREMAGGLVGGVRGTEIVNCYATGAVSADLGVVGGLVGNDLYSITNCHATGAVSTGPDGQQAGGLAGVGGAITNCYATGAVSSGSSVGGLVGLLYGSTSYITNSYATGDVVASTGDGGGLAGSSDSAGIANCFASGRVRGGEACGGLIWFSCGPLSQEAAYLGNATNCYATGAVTGKDQLGGLVGCIHEAVIAFCYATGDVSPTETSGGLVGYEEDVLGRSVVFSSYWNVQTTGLATSALGTSETTALMKQQATFAAWDFAGVWGILENTTYPFFRNVQYPPLAPLNVSPANGATRVPVAPTLAASAFVDRNTSDTHAASQWQVRAASSPSSWTLTVFDSGATAAALTSCAVPAGALTYLTDYVWRVRYEDNHGGWSAWSTPTAFQTRDVPLPAPAAVAASKGAFADRVRVTWIEPIGGSDYRVWRSTHPTTATATALATWAPGTTYDDLTAEPGVLFYYWVVAASSASGANMSAFSACDRGWAGAGPAFPSNYRGALFLVH